MDRGPKVPQVLKLVMAAVASGMAAQFVTFMTLFQPGDEIVVLCSPIVPHKITKGYGVSSLSVVTHVNDQKVRNLRHLITLIKENKEKFESQYPADFICEAVDQTRGWFYSLHAISTLLKDSEAFKNVICLGLSLDAEGQKMSKTRGNAIDPWEVINQHGADATRWYLYTASPPGQERRFSTELKLAVVAETMQPGMSISYVARRHGLSPSLVFSYSTAETRSRRCSSMGRTDERSW